MKPLPRIVAQMKLKALAEGAAIVRKEHGGLRCLSQWTGPDVTGRFLLEILVLLNMKHCVTAQEECLGQRWEVDSWSAGWAPSWSGPREAS